MSWKKRKKRNWRRWGASDVGQRCIKFSFSRQSRPPSSSADDPTFSLLDSPAARCAYPPLSSVSETLAPPTSPSPSLYLAGRPPAPPRTSCLPRICPSPAPPLLAPPSPVAGFDRWFPLVLPRHLLLPWWEVWRPRTAWRRASGLSSGAIPSSPFLPLSSSAWPPAIWSSTFSDVTSPRMCISSRLSPERETLPPVLISFIYLSTGYMLCWTVKRIDLFF